MTLPANIRVDMSVPFPALTQGSGPVTVTKVNGVWTLGFSMSGLAIETPPTSSLATDYLLVFDSIAGNLFRVPMNALPATARTQRFIGGSAALPIAASDQILNVSASSGGFVISAPAGGGRAGSPLTFKLVSGGSAFTISATSPDTFDGQSSLVVNGGSVTLVPYNDGINTSGYAVE